MKKKHYEEHCVGFGPNNEQGVCVLIQIQTSASTDLKILITSQLPRESSSEEIQSKIHHAGMDRDSERQLPGRPGTEEQVGPSEVALVDFELFVSLPSRPCADSQSWMCWVFSTPELGIVGVGRTHVGGHWSNPSGCDSRAGLGRGVKHGFRAPRRGVPSESTSNSSPDLSVPALVETPVALRVVPTLG